MARARSATSSGRPSAAHRHRAAQLVRLAGQHPGLRDQGWGQRVHRDSLVREAAGQEVGQPAQPGFRGRIVRPDDPAGERGHRRHEQDPAESARRHARQRALGQQERGAQVDRHHLVEIGGGHFRQRLPAAQPGVADQHRDRAEGVLYRATSSPGAAGRLRSAPSAMAMAPVAAMSAAVRSAAYAAVPVAHRHLRPGRRQPVRHRPPDPAAAPGNQGHLAGQWRTHLIHSSAVYPAAICRLPEVELRKISEISRITEATEPVTRRPLWVYRESCPVLRGLAYGFRPCGGGAEMDAGLMPGGLADVLADKTPKEQFDALTGPSRLRWRYCKDAVRAKTQRPQGPGQRPVHPFSRSFADEERLSSLFAGQAGSDEASRSFMESARMIADVTRVLGGCGGELREARGP